MRVRFFEPTSEGEARVRLATERGVGRFWHRIGQIDPQVGTGSAWASIGKTLSEIHPGLELRSWNGGCALRPSSDPGLVPLSQWIVELAPPTLRSEISAGLPPRPVDQVLGEVATATRCDFSQAQLRVGVTRGHLLELALQIPQMGDPDAAEDAACELALRVLGDDVFQRWIATVRVSPATSGGPLKVINPEPTQGAEQYPIEMLSSLVDVAMRGITQGLNDQPDHAWCERAPWTMLESNAISAQTDGCGDRQDDLVMKTTMKPEAAKCFLDGSPFSSQRFSRFGETQCYVKYSSTAATVERRLRERAVLEDRLNYALVPARLGCVVGTGIGSAFDYIDLSLANLEHGLKVTREALRESGCPSAAWLLFCDSTWTAEWLEIHPGQGAPPSLPQANAARTEP